MIALRHPPAPGEPIRVLFGRPRFTAGHAWPDIPAGWTGPLGPLADRVVIESAGHNEMDARLLDQRDPVHVVVPTMSPVTGPVIERGSFGLVQQFGAGVDSIDLRAAARCGVQVANMPGLNAVPVAEHALALLLALARRLPAAGDGFQPGAWGEPGGRSLAGSTAAVIGLGAVGTEIARRLTAFDIRVIGVRRRPQSAGQPPLIDGAAIAAMRPGALLVNVARGGLLDERAALAALDTGQLGGLGTALTSGFFRTAGDRLGQALHSWINGQPPENLVAPRWPSGPGWPGPARPTRPP
jgi:phosphoglycerate dehydrogenase-like enzyme